MAKISDLTLVQVALTKGPQEIVKANSNTDVATLVDEIGELRQMQKALKKMEGILQQLMFSRLPNGPLTEETREQYNGYVVKGHEKEATITMVVQSRFNSQSFKKSHPGLYANFTYPVEFHQLKFPKSADDDGDGDSDDAK